MYKFAETIKNYKDFLKSEQKNFNQRCDRIHTDVLDEFEKTANDETRRELLGKQSHLLDEAYNEFSQNIQKKDKELLRDIEKAEMEKDANEIQNIDEQLKAA